MAAIVAVSTDTCRKSVETNEMSTASAQLDINCVSNGMIGLNKVRCFVPEDDASGVSKHVYVLCPGEFNFMGLTILKN